jgi:hypothetical protein
MAEEKTTTSRRLRIFERAVWMKSNKYITSGSITVVSGIVITILGILLVAGNYASPTVLIVGLGTIVFIVGIIRLLIGFINPIVPADLPPLEEPAPVHEGLTEEQF